MKHFFLKISALGSLVVPYAVSAQNYIGSKTTGVAYNSFKDIVDAVGKFVTGTLMPILAALAFLYFFWNMIQYIRNLDNEKERENFRKYSINSLLGLFILLSVWGIVGIATRSFFGAQPVVPQFRTSDVGGVKPK